ncbi:MAG TPA: class I SAM-dependent methyltransferase [Candidatus Gallacutalibacter stercoravium]|nr:class I SAM-dependent methyltransferase [Candidatus Gallacutalibacter stercoravium]
MRNNQEFDLWADGYDASVNLSNASGSYPFAGYQEVLDRIYEIVRKACGKQILDIGFGTAVLTAKLYQDGYTITGIDFSKRMIEIAQQKMPGARLIQYDFCQGLPNCLSSTLFDAIICTYAIHHLTDEQKICFLKTLCRYLTPGGKILVGDVSFSTRAELEACKKSSGDAWDDEEFYFVADEICAAFPFAKYEKISHCAGVLLLENTAPTGRFRTE